MKSSMFPHMRQGGDHGAHAGTQEQVPQDQQEPWAHTPATLQGGGLQKEDAPIVA